MIPPGTDRRRSARPADAAGTPHVSFIVASGYVPTVGDAVRSVLAQHRADRVAEILVCGADVHGRVPPHPRVTVLDGIEPGPACRAYNVALARAAGEIAVILDGDCTLAADWLTIVLDRLAEGWDGVSGGVVAPAGPWMAAAYNLTLFHDWLSVRPAARRPCLPTMNLALRMDMVRAVGPLREDLPRVYDFDWTLRMTRAGHRLYFEPRARAEHRPLGLSPRRMWRTSFADGSCSQLVRRANAEIVASPRLLEHPRLLAALSPAVASWATARAMAHARGDARIWTVWPMLWASKLAWALGASHGRRHGPLPVARFQRPAASHTRVD